MKILCRLFTRGKHSFRLKDYRYRCRWCGELRMHVIRQPRLFSSTAGIEVAQVPLETKIPELGGELHGE